MNFDNGVFLEAGANNGVKQSNTYYLEAIRNWKGILVEPVPDLYKQCLRRRKSSKVYHAALVSNGYADDTIRLSFADLMTVVKDGSASEKHTREGRALQRLDNGYDFDAPAMTLDSVIESSGFRQIDFLSLDLEGYEAEALSGLNLMRNGPRYLLVEVREMSKILDVVGNYYRELEVLTDGGNYKDVLFVKVTPSE